MPIFVDKSRTALYEFTDPDGNRAEIVYRLKMDWGTRSTLEEELMNMRLDTANPDAQEIRFSIQKQKQLLLYYNIVSWRGKGFVNPKAKNGSMLRPTKQVISLIDYKLNAYWLDELCDLISTANEAGTVEVDPRGDPDKQDFLAEGTDF